MRIVPPFLSLTMLACASAPASSAGRVPVAGGRRRSRPDHSQRRRPEDTTLHKVVRANLRTPHAAVEHGYALAPPPTFVLAEPEGYPHRGLLCPGLPPPT